MKGGSWGDFGDKLLVFNFRNMTFLSKIFLFIVSYLPLFIIFVIMDYQKFDFIFPYFYFSHNIIIWLLIILMLFSLFYIFVLFLIFKKYTEFHEPWIIDNIENSNHEILAYLFTYVIPFLWMPSEKKMLITIILLLVSFTVFIKSDLIKYNFVLLLLWFDILKINLVEWKTIFLLKKHSINLSKWKIIIYWEIAKDLY